MSVYVILAIAFFFVTPWPPRAGPKAARAIIGPRA